MQDKDNRLIWEQYDAVTNRSAHATRVVSEQNVELVEDFYRNLIDQHGGDKAMQGYKGLTPEPGTSEASQFINVMAYLTDTLTEQKSELAWTIIQLFDDYGARAMDFIYALFNRTIDIHEIGIDPKSYEPVVLADEVMRNNHLNGAATTYKGLTPGSGDTEARQFQNMLLYIFNQQTNSKMKLFQDVLFQPNAHLDVAYNFSDNKQTD